MELVNVLSGASDNLLNAVTTLVNNRGLDIRNVACFNSDGASTMLGSKSDLKV